MTVSDYSKASTAKAIIPTLLWEAKEARRGLASKKCKKLTA